MFLLSFMTLEYPLIPEIQLALFKKQLTISLKKLFLIYKKGEALTSGNRSHLRTSPPYGPR